MVRLKTLIPPTSLPLTLHVDQNIILKLSDASMSSEFSLEIICVPNITVSGVRQ
jgi:hypothetical protein